MFVGLCFLFPIIAFLAYQYYLLHPDLSPKSYFLHDFYTLNRTENEVLHRSLFTNLMHYVTYGQSTQYLVKNDFQCYENLYHSMIKRLQNPLEANTTMEIQNYLIYFDQTFAYPYYVERAVNEIMEDRDLLNLVYDLGKHGIQGFAIYTQYQNGQLTQIQLLKKILKAVPYSKIPLVIRKLIKIGRYLPYMEGMMSPNYMLQITMRSAQVWMQDRIRKPAPKTWKEKVTGLWQAPPRKMRRLTEEEPTKTEEKWEEIDPSLQAFDTEIDYLEMLRKDALKGENEFYETYEEPERTEVTVDKKEEGNDNSPKDLEEESSIPESLEEETIDSSTAASSDHEAENLKEAKGLEEDNSIPASAENEEDMEDSSPSESSDEEGDDLSVSASYVEEGDDSNNLPKDEYDGIYASEEEGDTRKEGWIESEEVEEGSTIEYPIQSIAKAEDSNASAEESSEEVMTPSFSMNDLSALFQLFGMSPAASTSKPIEYRRASTLVNEWEEFYCHFHTLNDTTKQLMYELLKETKTQPFEHCIQKMDATQCLTFIQTAQTKLSEKKGNFMEQLYKYLTLTVTTTEDLETSEKIVRNTWHRMKGLFKRTHAYLPVYQA